MGYYNLPAAKLPPSNLSPEAAALQAVGSMAALEVIHKLHYNLAVAPKEDKYRRIKLSNSRIQADVVQCPGALDALRALGWVEASSEELALPAGKYMTMAQVRMIDDAKQLLSKKQQEAFKKDMRAATATRATTAVSAQA